MAGCHEWFMWLVVNLCLLLGEISIALTTELLQFDGRKLFLNLQEVLSIYLLFVSVFGCSWAGDRNGVWPIKVDPAMFRVSFWKTFENID